MQSGGGGLLEKKIGGGPHNDRCLPAETTHTQSAKIVLSVSGVWEHSLLPCAASRINRHRQTRAY